MKIQDYQIERYQPAQRARVADVIGQLLGGDRAANERYFRWRFSGPTDKFVSYYLSAGSNTGAAQLDIPVLWFLAEKDQNVPYAASHAALQKVKDVNTQLELITVQDSPHSFLLEGADGKLHYTRNYWSVMSAWLWDRGIVAGE